MTSLHPEIRAVLEGRSQWCVVTGNCLDILPTIPAGSVGAVVTDPPYGIGHSSGHGASWEDTQIAGDGDTRARDSVIEWAERLSLPWSAFGTWKVATPTSAKGVLVWDKGPASGMGDLSFPWKSSWEEIAVGGLGWKGSRGEGVLRGHLVVTWESKGRCHPHQKPESLVIELLDRLPTGIVVFDPFTGSGTTGVACIQTGRRFIGIEIDEKYAAIARRRIADAAPLFVPPPPAPEPELYQ